MIAVVVVAFLISQGALSNLFAITGDEAVTRSGIPQNDIGPGEDFTVDFMAVSATGLEGKWGASVVSEFDCPGESTVTDKFVLYSGEGDFAPSETAGKTYTMPNEGGVTCTLSGDFKFGDQIAVPFSEEQVSTRDVCQSGADSNSDGIVSREELATYIDEWVNGQISRTTLGNSIMEWIGGC